MSQHPPEILASALWRRLEVPGHDTCRLLRTSGWRIEGTAVFREDDRPALINYTVDCALTWHTLQGHIRGWVGTRPVEFRIERTNEGQWKFNDRPVPGLENCVDLDLGFTPATNLLQLRRIGLEVGRTADVPVAWLDVSSETLELVHQRYERRNELIYWYDAPAFDYQELLEVTPGGFIRVYPGLWELEAVDEPQSDDRAVG